MKMTVFGLTTLSTIAVLAAAQVCSAGIISSGSGETLRYGYHAGLGGGIDADTLHYWSLDQTGTISGVNPFADTGSSANLISMASETTTLSQPSVLFLAGGAANNARRIGTGSAGANRITAFANTNNTLADNLTLDQANSFFGPDGAITIDLLIRPDFGSSDTFGNTMRILSQENDEANPSNLLLIYDANANGLGHLIEFSLGGDVVKMAVPTGDDPHALAVGSWYHFAVTYNGDENSIADNVKFYWTKVDGPLDTTTAANLVSTDLLSADPLTLAARPEFTFGNETAGSINKSFFGALDEIRISGVDRDPDGNGGGFIFVPEPTGCVLLGISILGLGSYRIRPRQREVRR